MREFTTEEWLSELTGLVSALTASEELLLRRLQQLRRAMEAVRLSPLPTSPLSISFDPRPREEAVNPFPVREKRPAEWSAPAEPSSPAAPPADVSSTAQRISDIQETSDTQEIWRSQDIWPRVADERAPAAVSTTRSYDYFAELDEKLAVLQQSGRGA